MYSAAFATYYDQLMGDTTTITSTTERLVTRYIPKKGRILELGCGTGTILKTLSNSYTVSGIDHAEGMLAIARKKIPHATLYHKDIRSFQLPESFDGIICIFDTLNHLTSISDWEKVFRRVSNHLKKDGIFIFDCNTPKRMETIAALPPHVTKLNNDTLVCVKVSRERPYLYNGRFQIFQRIHDEKIEYIEENVRELVQPSQKIEVMLSQYFTLLKKVDPIRSRVTSQSGRVFFVCRKK
jgi:ubiquinone/menaquinone biosynthesis C-methylase UbiE